MMPKAMLASVGQRKVYNTLSYNYIDNKYMSKTKSKFKLNMEEINKETEKLKEETNQLQSAKENAKNTITTVDSFCPSLARTNTSEDKNQLHKECQQRIVRLEVQCQLGKDKAYGFEEENKRLKENVSQVRKRLEEQGKHLARANGLYSQQMKKTLHYKQQVDKLTTTLRATTTKYKNTVTAYRAKHSFQESVSTHERAAVNKILRHYQQQIYHEGEVPQEEVEMRRLVELSELQQADIEALLGKIVEKEEYYQNSCTTNEEILKRERDEIQFSGELCTKIDVSLANLKETDTYLIEKCVEVNTENAQLRQRITELTAEVALMLAAQNNIKRYEQELKGLIREFQVRTCGEIDRQVIANELATQRERNRRQEEEVARKTERIEKLVKQKTDDEKGRTVLQEELEQSQLKNKTLVRQLDTLKRLHQSQILARSKLLSSMVLRSDVRVIENCKQRPVLAASEILDGMKEQVKQELIAKIESARSGRKIAKTRLLFSEGNYEYNFGNRLTTPDVPLLLLVKVDDQRLIGGFASLSFPSTTTTSDPNEEPAFLFTCSDGESIRCFYKKNKEFSKLRALKYTENCLAFGNSELIVRNNSHEKQILLNTNIFGAVYYQQVDKRAFLAGDSNKLSYKQLEIHTIDFL